MTPEIAIVPTGTANLASVLAAFGRLGVTAEVSTDPEVVLETDGVVLPGVGAFGAAIGELDRLGLRHALVSRIEHDRPTAAICVGLQLLAQSSAESPMARGLGVIPGHVDALPSSVVVPQLGWNQIEVPNEARFLNPGWAYFANSYALEEAPDGWTIATADHGGSFIAAMEHGNVLACQFHPELSGSFGLTVLDAWLTVAREAA
ncbi:MAG: imidazole glycerol phosphate synthase subunit HisH [Acidimicrobiia bacterium]